MTAVRVSIVIPTQRRPEPLERAMRSAFVQSGVDPRDIELIVADNDSVPSARGVVERLDREAPFAVRYVHEPRAGVSSARNAAMAAVQGEFVAFLDDDEEASPGWLAALIETQARFDADVVFGPVEARIPAAVSDHRAYLTRFFSRLGPVDACLLEDVYGCGDSLVRVAALPDRTQPFNLLSNQIGGEDDVLFTAMREAGSVFAWSPRALVYEDPAPDRLTLRYTIARAFAFGQGAPCRCVNTPGREWGAIGWMAVGVAQATMRAPLAALAWVTRRRDRAEAFDKLARSLGKVFWWKPFKIRFYGLTDGQRSAVPV
ncbi:MAG TPA: glycosyltransferase family 2 protein [Caulobacteraceae bacterium]|nr:glycosyltransferase family 2 protein [Caulobacteraceae bacterium]